MDSYDDEKLLEKILENLWDWRLDGLNRYYASLPMADKYVLVKVMCPSELDRLVSLGRKESAKETVDKAHVEYLGEFVRSKRTDRGLKSKEVSEGVNRLMGEKYVCLGSKRKISPSLISKLEKGRLKRNFSESVYDCFFEVLGTNRQEYDFFVNKLLKDKERTAFEIYWMLKGKKEE